VAAGFQTFQTVKNYDDALGRHGQWVRWLKGSKCACVHGIQKQPDPQCNLCDGKGFVYRNPDEFTVLQENLKYGGSGIYYPLQTPVVSIQSITHQGVDLTLSGSQPADGSYIAIDFPYLKPYNRVKCDYTYSSKTSVTDENSEVIADNILRTVATRFTEKGKTFEGSVFSVSKVYNATKDENYTVSSFSKEFIYLVDMGTWASGDVLEVSYTYIHPFYFMMHTVSEKMRYEKSYILESADAILVAPSWFTLSADDLFTALAQEAVGRIIINPTARTGNDIIENVFDLASVPYVMDKNGVSYKEGTNFVVTNRNELKWITSKPTVNYSVEYLHHPTFRGLGEMSTVRNAENKVFANRINVKLWQGASEGMMF
jgi:hypothetical protein